MQGLLSAAKGPALQTSLAKAALSTGLKAGTTVLRPQAPAFVKSSSNSATQSVRAAVASAVVDAPPPPVDSPINERDSLPSTPRRSTESAVVLKFVVPSSIVGPSVGKEGENAQAVLHETGATIQFTKPGNAVYSSKDRMLIISGDTPDACKQAFGLFMTNLENEGVIDRLRRTTGGPHNDKIFFRQVIPANCAGKVLGPGGEQISKIAAKSNCAVVVEAKPENAAFVPFRFVNYMARDSAAIVAAVEEVMDAVLLEEKYAETLKYIQSVCFKIVELPEKRAGSLLGPGGAHIKALQEVLRCKMGICESSTKPGSRFISIWGQPANVKVAVDLVYVATGQQEKLERAAPVDHSDTASVASSSLWEREL